MRYGYGYFVKKKWDEVAIGKCVAIEQSKKFEASRRGEKKKKSF